MKKSVLIFTVMIGLLTTANSQTVDNDSSTVQDKSRIAVFKNGIYAYGQYGLSILTKVENSIVSAV